jgi:hypothetical protein
MDEEEDKDMAVVGEGCLFYLIVVKWDMCHYCVLIFALIMGIVTEQNISHKISQICWESGKKRKHIVVW